MTMAPGSDSVDAYLAQSPAAHTGALRTYREHCRVHLPEDSMLSMTAKSHGPIC